MGNSRSRSSASRRASAAGRLTSRQNSSTSNESTSDLDRLAYLIFLRQEREQRQHSRRSVAGSAAPAGGTGGGNSSATRRMSLRDITSTRREEAGGGTTRVSPPSQQRSLLRRFIQQHLLMEYLDRNIVLSDEDEELGGLSENANENNNDSDSSGSTLSYEGVPELFANEEAAQESKEREASISRQADKIRRFKLQVLELFDAQKRKLQLKISSANNIQETLSYLVSLKQDAATKEDEKQLDSIDTLLKDIHGSEDFLDAKDLVRLGQDLDDIVSNVAVLRELTSVRNEDEVLCTVCLSCPLSVIWDCVKCDNLVCDACRNRITACPTCRVRFRNKPPRRNRWAEKLARLQNEKQGLE